MNFLALAFMSSVSAATPTTPMPWFQNEDYPDDAFVRKEQGTTIFDVVVSPTGRPTDCSIVTSSGSPTLDRRACQVAMRTARFTAATGADGLAAYGIYRSQVHWSLDPEQWTQMEVGPDVELALSRLPTAATQPIDVKFAYYVDAQGSPVGCSAIGPSHPQELDTLGCQHLLEKMPRAPFALRKAGAIPVVRTAWVRFSPSH